MTDYSFKVVYLKSVNLCCDLHILLLFQARTQKEKCRQIRDPGNKSIIFFNTV